MKKTLFIVFFLLIDFYVVFACFWDYDTVEMERQQFPSVIELISGKFLKHSPEFHYWRIKDREKKLLEFPDSLSLYDDLAVSYSKIGDNKKAIEIILKKENLHPGLYETYANLGTFYLHDGQFKKGIEFIDKAIEVNPDAHFGREIYQRHLAEYVLGKMKNGKISLPLDPAFYNHPEFFMSDEKNNFYTFLLENYKSKFNPQDREAISELPKEELDKALKGIMGMMKFGNHNSPVLLEVLGDLLMNAGDESGARQLAARAYFKASYEVDNEEAKEIYNKRIVFVLYHQYTKRNGAKFTLYELEDLLKEEIEEGNKFYQQIRNDEIAWIGSGKNPEKEFAAKYYKEPAMPERIQHGGGGRRDIEEKYIRDTSIGQYIDYYALYTQEVTINTTQKQLIDSLFDHNSNMDENEHPNEEKKDPAISVQAKPKTPITKPLLIILVFIIVSSGIFLWLRRKKKQEKGNTD